MVLGGDCHEFSGYIGFSHFLDCFGSTCGIEQEKKVSTLLVLATYMMRPG